MKTNPGLSEGQLAREERRHAARPALPLTFYSLLSGMLLARTVLAPMRYGETFDAIPYLPSVVMVGLILAILAQHDTIRSANPIAEAPPVPA